MKRLAILVATMLIGISITSAEEITDVIFSTRYAPGRPKTAEFYYEDRAIGRGRDGFQFIVDKIRELPPGASVVWGPNYRRCGACSGMEPPCVPKFLYPDLWGVLEQTVKERRLSLSSDYPGPWLELAESSPRFRFPKEIVDNQRPIEGRFDVMLDWEIGLRNDVEDQPQPRRLVWLFSWHRVINAETEFADKYDLEVFLNRFADRARLLLRIQPKKKLDVATDDDSSNLAGEIRSFWHEVIGPISSRKNFKVVITAPDVLLEPLKALAEEVHIAWHNYHGASSSLDGVVYELDGEFCGMGDAGLEEILARLKKLPAGAVVAVPHYEYGGRWTESYDEDEIERANQSLKEAIPFRHRLDEFKTVVRDRKLDLQEDIIYPKYQPRTVLDWQDGDRKGRSFAAFGRIVRYDEQPTKPALRLGWSQYKMGSMNDENEYFASRQLESEAVYTVDKKNVGQGVPGFTAAMKKVESLAEGSIVHVSVCIRTKGPFVCPITFEGCRHFERTGFEPYFGMFPWLIDVARKKKLAIEWIPDEAKTCADCELNK